MASLPKAVRDELDRLRREAERKPRPSDLRPETLSAIQDSDLDEAVTWYVHEQFRMADALREEVVARFSKPVQTAYLVWLLEAEVLNGGFNQYFWNVEPGLVAQTPDALTAIGADEVRTLVVEAIAQGLAEEATRMYFKAEGTLQAFSDSYEHSKLEAFDERFSAMCPMLPTLRSRYLRCHQGQLERIEP